MNTAINVLKYQLYYLVWKFELILLKYKNNYFNLTYLIEIQYLNF
jgi:hypothetical protein